MPAGRDPKAREGKDAFLRAGQIFVLILWLVATLHSFNLLGLRAAWIMGIDRSAVVRNFLAIIRDESYQGSLLKILP